MKPLSIKKVRQKRILLIENDEHYDAVVFDKIEKFLVDLYNTGFNAKEREEILLTGILHNKENVHMESEIKNISKEMQ